MKKTINPLLLLLVVPLFALPMAAAASPSWTSAAEGALAVTSLTFVGNVSRRKPARPRTEFSADGKRVYAYLRVLNKGPRRQLRLVWRRDGKAHHTTRLGVGRSRNWRTWGYIRARRGAVGSWTVSVFDPDNNELAKAGFRIVE